MTQALEYRRAVLALARDLYREFSTPEDFVAAASSLYPEHADDLLKAISDPAFTLRDDQIMPWDKPYLNWLLLTGRGYGKNYAASCAINEMALYVYPGKQGIIVGATLKDVRDTIIFGESGLKACAPPGMEPHYNQNLQQLQWPNGSVGVIRSGENPEDIRGLSVPWAYMDELIKFPDGNRSYKNVTMCVRSGDEQRIVITSTPLRKREYIKEIADSPNTVYIAGKSSDNPFLPDNYHEMQKSMLSEKEYLEEALGEWASDAGTLWSREQIERCNVRTNVDPVEFMKGARRRGFSIDPSGGKRDRTGIIMWCESGDYFWAMNDFTDAIPLKQSQWLAQLSTQVERYLEPGDYLIVETNGAMGIEDTLRQAFPHLRIEPVYQAGAKNGKIPRAERAQIQYERGKVKHFRPMVDLERQMEDFYDVVEDRTKSPDRVDALCMAINWTIDNPAYDGGFLTVDRDISFDW